MPRYGQFQVYGGHAPKEEFDIIDNKDYRLRVRKKWIDATNEWHLEFISLSIHEHRFEMFLSHEEIARIKDIL